MATLTTTSQQDSVEHLRQQHVDRDIPLTILNGQSREDEVLTDHDEAPANAVEAIPDGGYGWTIVAACSLLLFFIMGYTTAWGVLQTALVKASPTRLDIRTVTFVGSLYMACMVAFGPISIRLMAAFGLRYTLLSSVAMFGIGLICTSFTLNNLGGLFCVAGMIVGISTSLLFTATNSLPTQWFGSKLGTANGLVKTGGGVGATVVPILAQKLTDKFGLPWAFRILGFMVLAVGIPCAFLIRERTGVRPPRFDWAMLKVLPTAAITLAGAISVFGLYVPPFFLPLFAESIGLSASTGAGLVAGFGGATAVGRLFSGWLCDRIGAINALVLASLINGLSMLAIWPVSSSLGPLYVFAIVNGCANGSFFVSLPTAVATLATGSPAASITLMTFFWTPGYLLGPAIAGVLVDITGAQAASSIGPYRAAIFYAAGTGILATILIVVSRVKLDSKLVSKL